MAHIVDKPDTPGRYVMMVDDPEMGWRHIIEVEAGHTDAAAVLAARAAIANEVANGNPANIPTDEVGQQSFLEGTVLYAEPLSAWVKRVSAAA